MFTLCGYGWRREYLCNVCKVVLDLSWCETTEAPRGADTHLNVVTTHLALKTLFEGQDGCVHCIIQLQIFSVPG